MQMLALAGTARRWELKRLRLRLFSCAGRIAKSSRRLRLRLARTWPWADLITTAITRPRGTPPTQRDSWATTLTHSRKPADGWVATRPNKHHETSRLRIELPASVEATQVTVHPI
jgi:hypothetical protein